MDDLLYFALSLVILAGFEAGVVVTLFRVSGFGKVAA